VLTGLFTGAASGSGGIDVFNSANVTGSGNQISILAAAPPAIRIITSPGSAIQ
jgi:hypothetical protein